MDKEAMRAQIKQYVMQMTGRSNANSTVTNGGGGGFGGGVAAMMVPSMINRHMIGAERIRSYYPLCDGKNANSEENEDSFLLRLQYAGIHNSDAESVVESAVLRLYRIKVQQQHNDSDVQEQQNTGYDHSCRSNFARDDKAYRISVYFNGKSVAKKHRSGKRKLCDSKVIFDSAKFVDLSVLVPVRAEWASKGKTLNFAVQVEDQFGTPIKADLFFKGPTCSVGMSTPHPVPTILDERHDGADFGGDAATTFALHRAVLYPQLDVKSVMVSNIIDTTGSSSSSSTDFKCRSSSAHVRHSGHSRSKRPQQSTANSATATSSSSAQQPAAFRAFADTVQNQQRIDDPEHVHRLLSTFDASQMRLNQ